MQIRYYCTRWYQHGKCGLCVTIACNCLPCAAGGRTTRSVNPIAWEQGMVYCQCGQCEVWHVLAANNPDIYEEIRYNE